MFSIEKLRASAKELGLEITENSEKPGMYDNQGNFICTFEDAVKPLLLPVQKQTLLTDELKATLIHHQLEWVNTGNLWSKGFVEGIEYMLKQAGEFTPDIYK